MSSRCDCSTPEECPEEDRIHHHHYYYYYYYYYLQLRAVRRRTLDVGYAHVRVRAAH